MAGKRQHYNVTLAILTLAGIAFALQQTMVIPALPALQRDLIAVISKYVKIDPTHLKVDVARQDNLEVLEVKIELPDGVR